MNGPQGMPVFVTKQYHHFGYTVQTNPDGSRVLVCEVPNGERLVLLFSEESAKDIGKALSAPSVHIPQNGEAPDGLL